MTEEKNNNKEEIKTEAKAEVPSVESPTESGESNKKEAPKKEAGVSPSATVAPNTSQRQPQNNSDRRGGPRARSAQGGSRGRRNTRKGFGKRVKSEFDQKVIDIRRVTRVVSGGRRFSFSVALVAGNRKGSVGVGVGKSSDTSSAIEKASRNAKKNMVKLKLTKKMSIPHEVQTKFASTRVLIKPAPGKGLVAGSSVRNVLDLAGVKDVSSKLLSRSKNKLNNARAAVDALKQFK